MSEQRPGNDGSWRSKFRCAFRGQKLGFRGESSFFVHFFVAAVVVTAAATLEANRLEWSLLLLCIAIVLAAETFNSAIEQLAKAVTKSYNPNIRDALDMSSGAVLTTAFGAAAVGTIILGRMVLEKINISL
jgi:diacylglycerol kinase